MKSLFFYDRVILLDDYLRLVGRWPGGCLFSLVFLFEPLQSHVTGGRLVFPMALIQL